MRIALGELGRAEAFAEAILLDIGGAILGPVTRAAQVGVEGWTLLRSGDPRPTQQPANDVPARRLRFPLLLSHPASADMVLRHNFVMGILTDDFGFSDGQPRL